MAVSSRDKFSEYHNNPQQNNESRSQKKISNQTLTNLTVTFGLPFLINLMILLQSKSLIKDTAVS